MKTAKAAKKPVKPRRPAQTGLLNLVEVARILKIPARTLDTPKHRREILERIAVLPRGIQKRYSGVLLAEFLAGKFKRK